MTMNTTRKITYLIFIAVLGTFTRVASANCKVKPVDIVFILDASNSIWNPDFNRGLAFITDLLTSFDIGPSVSQTHVGILTFGHEVWPQFYLDSRKSFDEIKNAIQKITHGNGRRTNTGDALEFTRDIMFSPYAGGRGNVARIAVVVSDGRSQETLFTQEAAKRLKKEGVKLLAISIGSPQNHQELNVIASDPDREHKFALGDYNTFTAIKEKIVKEVCNKDPPPTTTETPYKTMTPHICRDLPVCAAIQATDLLFIFDAVALGSWKSQAISEFIALSIRQIDLVSNVLRVGRETENCLSGNIRLGSAHHASDMSEIRFHTFSEMLKRITRNSFSVKNGGRKGAFKMAVVFIDEGQKIADDVIREMNRLKETVDFLHIVAIGQNTRMVNLAMTLSNGRFINVRCYEELNSMADKLMSDICDFLFLSTSDV